jgi:hypothetical protein
MMTQSNKPKDQLETVPSNEELEAEHELEIQRSRPIRAISFFGEGDDEIKITSQTISELPLDVSSVTNWHIAENVNYYGPNLKRSDLSILNRNQQDIHILEISNFIVQSVKSIILNYVDSSRLIKLLDEDEDGDEVFSIRSYIIDSCSSMYNRTAEIIIQFLNSRSAPSSFRGTTTDGTLVEQELENTAALIDVLTKQLVQFILTDICANIENALFSCIADMSMETCIDKANKACELLGVDLNDVEANLFSDHTRQAFLSFMNAHIKNELVDVLNQIEDSVDNVMGNSTNTLHYIFDDLCSFSRLEELSDK